MSFKPNSFGKFTKSIQTFNLMELVLVVVILATLVAIMLPVFGPRSKANKQPAGQDNNSYPTSYMTQPATPAARAAVAPRSCAH